MRASHSNNSDKKLDMDSKSKKRMRRSELKKRSWLYNLREFKKISRSNKMSLPKKLKKVVKILLSIKS